MAPETLNCSINDIITSIRNQLGNNKYIIIVPQLNSDEVYIQCFEEGKAQGFILYCLKSSEIKDISSNWSKFLLKDLEEKCKKWAKEKNILSI